MDYFDLHCDSVTTAFSKKVSLASEELAVNVKKFHLFENYTQCYALWLDDSLHGEAAFEKAGVLYDFYIEQKGLLRGYDNHKPVLTLENAVSVGEKAENLLLWKKRGVAALTLTWNAENELACGADCKSGGLTALGADVVRLAEELNIAIDVSHLNEDSFYSLARLAKRPFMASHSCCYCICPHRRCLKDDQIRCIAEMNGIIGVNFYPAFLGGGDVFELVWRNIYHLLELGGEGCAAIGSDFDGAKMDARLSGLEDIPALRHFLSEKGLPQETLDRIFYKNARDFFARIN